MLCISTAAAGQHCLLTLPNPASKAAAVYSDYGIPSYLPDALVDFLIALYLHENLETLQWCNSSPRQSTRHTARY